MMSDERKTAKLLSFTVDVAESPYDDPVVLNCIVVFDEFDYSVGGETRVRLAEWEDDEKECRELFKMFMQSEGNAVLNGEKTWGRGPLSYII